MPLLTPYRQKIQVPVSNRVYGDTIIKQDVVFVRLQHNQDYISGVSTAEIMLLLRAYSSINGNVGVPLNDKGIPDRLIQLVADNSTLVDVATGALLAIRTGETNEAWNTLIGTFPQNTMLQGDYFAWLRDNHPLRIKDMILANITQADTMMQKFNM